MARVAARLAGILALAALVTLPPLLTKYHLEVLISVVFWAYLGIAWNILGGYAGQFSFGHAAYFGIGAYTSTLLFLKVGVTPWLGMLAGGVLAAGFDSHHQEDGRTGQRHQHRLRQRACRRGRSRCRISYHRASPSVTLGPIF